jgi:hypothetical protein
MNDLYFMLVNEDIIKVPMSYFELWLNQLKAGRKSTWINGSRRNVKLTKKRQHHYYYQLGPQMGSVITNEREPRSCLGRVFNSKLGCFATPGRKCIV